MQKLSFPWLGTGLGGALGAGGGLGVGHALGSKGKGLILPTIIGAASGAGLGGLLHSGISDTIAENKQFEHDKAIVEEWLRQNPDKRIRPDYTLVTPQMMHGDHFNRYMTSNFNSPTGQYVAGSVLSSWDYNRAKKQAEWEAYKQMLQLMGQQKQASSVPSLGTKGWNLLIRDGEELSPEVKMQSTLGFIPGSLIAQRLLKNRGALTRITGTLGAGALSAIMAPAIYGAAKNMLAGPGESLPQNIGFRGGIQ